MMSAPATYAAWVCLLDRFGEGDDGALETLDTASFLVDAGTALRFYQRVEEVYKKRKQSWLYQFQRSFQLHNCKTEADFAIVLRNGRKNLSPLSRFVMLKGFPDDLRNTLHKDLEDFVVEIKDSLKKNMSKNSNNREKILVLLNRFGLITEIDTIKNNENEKNNNNHPPTGRKIIF